MKRLALLAALLLETGFILYGVTRPAPDETPLPPPPLSVPPPVAPPGRAAAGTEAMLARPLFTPGRAPPGPEVPPAPPAAVPPRLTGLVIAERRGRAIFAGPDGKPVVFGEGEQLGPFTVVAVRPDGVDLAGPSGVRTLRPSGDAALRLPLKPLVLALIDPDRREAETENDQ